MLWTYRWAERAEHPPSLPQPLSSHGPVFQSNGTGPLAVRFRGNFSVIQKNLSAYSVPSVVLGFGNTDLIRPHSEGYRSFLWGIPCLMITYWVPVLNMGTLKVLKERQYSRNQIDNVTTPKSGPFAIFSHPSPNINMFLREIFQVVFDTCLILAFFFFSFGYLFP